MKRRRRIANHLRQRVAVRPMHILKIKLKSRITVLLASANKLSEHALFRSAILQQLVKIFLHKIAVCHQRHHRNVVLLRSLKNQRI